MHEISSLKSTPSKIVGAPSIRQMLRRCRSPWHSRTRPPRHLISSRAACRQSSVRVCAVSCAHRTGSRTPIPCSLNPSALPSTTHAIPARRRPCNDSRCGDDLADPWYVVPMFLGLPSPRLPARASALNSIPLAVAAAVHLLTVVAILLIVPPAARRMTHHEPIAPHAMPIVLPPKLPWP